MTEVGGTDCVSAWRNAATLLRTSGGESFNLVVTVENPTAFAPTWMTQFNPRSVAPDADRISDVVNTIFPYKIAAHCHSRMELYERYLRAYDRGRTLQHNRGAWGTYFQRLIRFGDPPVNQLERAIQKLTSWNTRSTTGLVFHPSSPSLDAPRTRGGPCWHFGELLWHKGDVVDFVAVYRNHDYFNKTLGNFIALGQLLSFICAAAQKTPGRLICHSVHAYHQSSDSQLVALAEI